MYTSLIMHDIVHDIYRDSVYINICDLILETSFSIVNFLVYSKNHMVGKAFLKIVMGTLYEKIWWLLDLGPYCHMVMLRGLGSFSNNS